MTVAQVKALLRVAFRLGRLSDSTIYQAKEIADRAFTDLLTAIGDDDDSSLVILRRNEHGRFERVS